MQEKDEIKICETSYALKVLDISNMSNCNASKMPMECRLKLNRDGEGSEVEYTLFRRIIGCLRYLTLTRPNLIYTVSFLSRFMSKPYSDHMTAAKRILRYVKGTMVAYDPRRHQDTMPWRRRSPFARADLSTYL